MKARAVARRRAHEPGRLALRGGLVAVTAALVALAAPLANASTMDVASTHAFIVAAVRDTRAVVARYGRERASMNAAIEHVAATCPAVLSRAAQYGTAAQQDSWGQLVQEASFDLILAQIAPIRGVVTVSTRTLARLHWTAPPINRAVATFVRESRATLALRAPDLCEDARASAAAGFSSVPASTTAFLRSARVAVPDMAPTGGDLIRMMHAYLTPGDRRAIRQLDGLDARLNRLVGTFEPGAYVRMVDALAGPPA